jgi:hypothetical protein
MKWDQLEWNSPLKKVASCRPKAHLAGASGFTKELWLILFNILLQILPGMFVATLTYTRQK